MDNILTSIYANLNDNPGNPNIQRIQAKIPPLQTRIADLTDKIGACYFTSNSYISPSLGQKKKINTLSTPTTLRTIRGISSIKIFIFPPKIPENYAEAALKA